VLLGIASIIPRAARRQSQYRLVAVVVMIVVVIMAMIALVRWERMMVAIVAWAAGECERQHRYQRRKCKKLDSHGKFLLEFLSRKLYADMPVRPPGSALPQKNLRTFKGT